MVNTNPSQETYKEILKVITKAQQAGPKDGTEKCPWHWGKIEIGELAEYIDQHYTKKT